MYNESLKDIKIIASASYSTWMCNDDEGRAVVKPKKFAFETFANSHKAFNIPYSMRIAIKVRIILTKPVE